MVDLSHHLGPWVGSWSTWLEPGVLHDESPLALEVSDAEGAGWVITYEGTIADDRVRGRLRVGKDDRSIEWVDTWHTQGIEESLARTPDGLPSYTYGPPDEQWTWSIEIIPEPHTLVITHWNTPPGGEPAVAVNMDLQRAQT